jgi:membrane complex biogenesis BtpA family protein
MGLPRLIGMVHLAPLPGSPGFNGDLSSVIDAAVADARVIATAGFDGLMIENFGDAPFFADDVPKETIASLTAAVIAVHDAAQIPTGVNALRNDALGALAVAAATPASFIRVNVLSGSMFTDQGPIVGKAAQVARLQKAICPDVAIMADVFVKHATPPAGLSLVDATHDLVERAGADAVVVSGAGTGSPADLADVETVSGASSLPVYLGSGVHLGNIGAMLGAADGAIIGTSIKVGGVSTGPVDEALAREMVAAAS